MTTSNRLLPRDDLGVRGDQVLGVPSVMAFVWFFEKPVSREALAAVHGRLARGPLNRAVKRSRVPGARDRWIPAPVVAPLAYSDEPISEAQVREELEAQGSLPMDLSHGPAWRLSATAVESGGTAVLLTCHHAVSDGLGALSAWAAAVEGEQTGELQGDEGLAADLADSARQWRAALVSLGSMIRSALRQGRGAGAERAADGGATRTIMTAADYRHEVSDVATFVPRRAFLEFSSEQFRKAAAERGGTPNSLFVAIATRFLVSTGVLPDGRAVTVSQRISDREAGDVRGNVVAGVDIPVDVDASMYQDLGPIRAASKTAFQQWEGGEDLGELDSPLIQLLPDWLLVLLAKPLTKIPTKILCTVSSLGKLPASAKTLDGQEARSLHAAFLLPKQDDAQLWRRVSSAVQGTLADAGDVTTLLIEGRNPECHAVEHSVFTQYVVDECARWGLEPLRVL